MTRIGRITAAMAIKTRLQTSSDFVLEEELADGLDGARLDELTG